MQEEEGNGKSPLLVFIVPGHGDSYREYQTLSNEVSLKMKEGGVLSEVYTLDYKE